MVGSPYQTVDTLWEDLQFIRRLKPQMVGIGPFIPQKDTPFGTETAGTMEMTLRLLSIIRLIHPHVLLPATTALGTIHPKGRELGILAEQMSSCRIYPRLPCGRNINYMIIRSAPVTRQQSAASACRNEWKALAIR